MSARSWIASAKLAGRQLPHYLASLGALCSPFFLGQNSRIAHKKSVDVGDHSRRPAAFGCPGVANCAWSATTRVGLLHQLLLSEQVSYPCAVLRQLYHSWLVAKLNAAHVVQMVAHDAQR